MAVEEIWFLWLALAQYEDNVLMDESEAYFLKSHDEDK